jgi:hypothetical protein
MSGELSRRLAARQRIGHQRDEVADQHEHGPHPCALANTRRTNRDQGHTDRTNNSRSI